MQISLEDTEIELIKKKLATDTFWIAQSILQKISSAESMQEERKNCKHKFGKYTGEKECCIYCGVKDVGMGESWKIK